MGIARKFGKRIEKYIPDLLEEWKGIDATEFLQNIPRTTGGNPLLADARGGLRVLECSAIKCVVLHPEKGCIASTNHYTDDDLFGLSPPNTESSKERFERIN